MKKFSKAACTLYPLFFFVFHHFWDSNMISESISIIRFFLGGERCYPFSVAISIASKSGAFWHFLRPQVFEKKSPHPAQDSSWSHLRPADLQVRYLDSSRINAENEIIQHLLVGYFFFAWGGGGEMRMVVVGGFPVVVFCFLKILKMFKS